MRLRSDLLFFAGALAGACTSNTAPAPGNARLRIVNSLYQGNSAATAVSVPLDVLLDSSTSAPGAVSGLVPNAVTDGTAGLNGAAAAGYTALPTGVHSFVARVTSPNNQSLYTSATSTYLPKQYLTPFPYTLVVAGIAPPSGLAAPTAVPWAMVVDDPYTPPNDPAGGLTARVQVINAAPMASTTGAGAEITAAFAGGPGTFTATANYRASSGYINPPGGDYTLTLSTGTTVLYTGSVTLGKGEVRSFLVQSTAHSDTPGPGNTKVTNLLDNQW